MKMGSRELRNVYFVHNGDVTYRVVHESWARRHGAGERWSVFGSQGIHGGIRLCDPEKGTHKRVVAETKRLLGIDDAPREILGA